MPRKFLQWGLVAFLIWYVVTRPNDAAGVIRQIGSWLVQIAKGLGTFISSLT